jgi:ABC-type sugar transport system permease subunit
MSSIIRLVPPRWRRRLRPWLLVLPGALVIGLVFGYPLVELVRLSLRNSFTGEFIGGANFESVFRDDTFWLALKHNGLLLLAVPITTVLAVTLAIFLFEGIRGGSLYRVLVFLPLTIGVPVTGTVWSLMLERNGGLNSILGGVGLGGLAQDWLGSVSLALWSVLAVIIWQQLGFGVVLFLARLLSIPPELFEAARLDGARWFRLHWRVTIPQLRGVLQFYVVLMTITMVSWVFGFVYVITGGGPADATTVAELHVYRLAFSFNQIGIASAAALLLFAAVFLFVIAFFRITRKEEMG